jgi:hypothetical protein
LTFSYIFCVSVREKIPRIGQFLEGIHSSLF